MVSALHYLPTFLLHTYVDKLNCFNVNVEEYVFKFLER